MNLLGLEGAKVEFTRMKEQIQKELQTFDEAIYVHLTTLLQDYFKDIE